MHVALLITDATKTVIRITHRLSYGMNLKWFKDNFSAVRTMKIIKAIHNINNSLPYGKSSVVIWWHLFMYLFPVSNSKEF